MQPRKITRNLLASFIEYAASEKVSALESERFLVNHYQDSLMESARKECAKILSGYSDKQASESKELLYALAKELRNAT